MRQGRHNKRLVYRMRSDGVPRDDDTLVAVFFTEEDAADYVELNNREAA